MAQIWIAICICVLLAYLKFTDKIDRSLQQILQLLQLNLFERRDLQTLLLGDPPDPVSATYTDNTEVLMKTCGTAVKSHDVKSFGVCMLFQHQHLSLTVPAEITDEALDSMLGGVQKSKIAVQCIELGRQQCEKV